MIAQTPGEPIRRVADRRPASFRQSWSLLKRDHVFHPAAYWRFRQNPSMVEITKVQCFMAFIDARDSLGVSPVVLSLWPRFEPFGVAMGVEHVPRFRRHRNSPTRKSPEFPRRNAKTRWGEPAGHFASSHLAVAVLVEAAGIEPASRDISMQASTCVVG